MMLLEVLWVLRVGCECPGSYQHKEAEVARLEQQVAVLASRVQELSSPGDTDTVPALKKKLWDLEGSAAEQKKELERQTAAVDHLEQVMWGWGRLGCVPTVHIQPRPAPSSSPRGCASPRGVSAPREAGAGDRAHEADPPEGAGGQGRGAGGHTEVLPEEGRSSLGGFDAGCSPKLPMPQEPFQGSMFPGKCWGAALPTSPHCEPQSQPGGVDQALGQG